MSVEHDLNEFLDNEDLTNQCGYCGKAIEQEQTYCSSNCLCNDLAL